MIGYLSTARWILTMSWYHLISLWRCILKNQDPTFKWHKKDWLLHLWVKVCVHKKSSSRKINSICHSGLQISLWICSVGSSGLLSIIHKLSLCTLDASVRFFLEENAFIFIYPPNLGCKSRLYLRPTHPRNLDQNWGGPDIPNWKLALTAENAKLILTIYDGLMLLKLQKQTATTTTTTTTPAAAAAANNNNNNNTIRGSVEDTEPMATIGM